ncbi:MAG: hypothetical protein EOO44_09055 [Flavobacterium sp.]|nr:MAG: hypothetical protein EOO44_09055 [Flavobacterium sp.]
MTVKNFGILASIDWNSNKWQDIATDKDLSHSNFGYVVDTGLTFTSLNFAHNIFPVDDKGYYWGLLPQLWSKMPDKEKAKFVEVVFIKSQNWEDKQNYIVGFYSFPIFERTIKPSPLPSFKTDFELNVKAYPNDIHLLENYINLTSNPDLKKYLPKDKELGKQGYNYLTKDNVFKILDAMSKLNPEDRTLSGIKLRLIKSIEMKR